MSSFCSQAVDKKKTKKKQNKKKTEWNQQEKNDLGKMAFSSQWPMSNCTTFLHPFDLLSTWKRTNKYFELKAPSLSYSFFRNFPYVQCLTHFNPGSKKLFKIAVYMLYNVEINNLKLIFQNIDFHGFYGTLKFAKLAYPTYFEILLWPWPLRDKNTIDVDQYIIL